MISLLEEGWGFSLRFKIRGKLHPDEKQKHQKTKCAQKLQFILKFTITHIFSLWYICNLIILDIMVTMEKVALFTEIQYLTTSSEKPLCRVSKQKHVTN